MFRLGLVGYDDEFGLRAPQLLGYMAPIGLVTLG